MADILPGDGSAELVETAPEHATQGTSAVRRPNALEIVLSQFGVKWRQANDDSPTPLEPLPVATPDARTDVGPDEITFVLGQIGRLGDDIELGSYTDVELRKLSEYVRALMADQEGPIRANYSLPFGRTIADVEVEGEFVEGGVYPNFMNRLKLLEEKFTVSTVNFNPDRIKGRLALDLCREYEPGPYKATLNLTSYGGKHTIAERFKNAGDERATPASFGVLDYAIEFPDSFKNLFGSDYWNIQTGFELHPKFKKLPLAHFLKPQSLRERVLILYYRHDIGRLVFGFSPTTDVVRATLPTVEEVIKVEETRNG